MNKKTIECIFGNPNLTSEEIEILQKYFKVNWKFAKRDHIYYRDPKSDIVVCSPSTILHSRTSNYQFELININIIKNHVNRLQEQETNLARRDGQPTSGIQCTSSKATIASGHFEYRTINFQRGGKAKIGKANLSF